MLVCGLFRGKLYVIGLLLSCADSFLSSASITLITARHAFTVTFLSKQDGFHLAVFPCWTEVYNRVAERRSAGNFNPDLAGSARCGNLSSRTVVASASRMYVLSDSLLARLSVYRCSLYRRQESSRSRVFCHTGRQASSHNNTWFGRTTRDEMVGQQQLWQALACLLG